MQVKAKERVNSQLTGPKPFPLERMLAIFYNIVDVSPSFFPSPPCCLLNAVLRTFGQIGIRNKRFGAVYGSESGSPIDL
jgi:hypothetical protein